MTKMAENGLLYVLMLGTGMVIYTCVGIEIANARAGYCLPRRATRPKYPKWRHIPWTDEESWKQSRGKWRFPDRGLRPDGSHNKNWVLSDSEHATMESEVSEANAHNSLLAWLGFLGLLQYPLVLVCLTLSVGLACRASGRQVRRAALACLPLQLTGLCFALYRGYFSSLGL